MPQDDIVFIQILKPIMVYLLRFNRVRSQILQACKSLDRLHVVPTLRPCPFDQVDNIDIDASHGPLAHLACLRQWVDANGAAESVPRGQRVSRIVPHAKLALKRGLVSVPGVIRIGIAPAPALVPP